MMHSRFPIHFLGYFFSNKCCTIFSLLLQTLLYIMAEIDKAIMGPVVSVNYTSQKGLQLNWNTKGMLLPSCSNTLKHLIILQKGQFEKTLHFLNTYYSKMRLGDLIGILKPSSKNLLKFKVVWLEKSNAITDLKEYIKQKYMLESSIVEILPRMVKLFQKNKELILVHIFPTLEIKKTKQFIKGLRYEGVDNIIFNLYDKSYEEDQCINVIEGVNVWSNYSSQQLGKTLNSMKIYTNFIALSRLSIRIQSLNGFLMSQNSGNWHNVDFSTIQKVYYGVFSHECSETLFFVTQDIMYNFTLELVIYLNYRLTTGKQITCKKKIILKNDNSKIYQRTYTVEEQTLKQYYLHKDITVMSNFAKREAIIWVSEIKDCEDDGL